MGASRRGPGGDLYISPHYLASDWKALYMRTSPTPDWAKAVRILGDRLNGRYLEPIKSMREQKDPAIRESCGFTVVAIDCLLIETLGQFYHGFDETPGRNDKKLNPQGLFHGDFYVQFLQDIGTLATDFDTDEKRKLFYKHFRCGILHQAQTKKKSRVRIDEPEMVKFPAMRRTELRQTSLAGDQLPHRGLLQVSLLGDEPVQRPDQRIDIAQR